MKAIVIGLLFLCLAGTAQTKLSVKDFGANADGKTDDSKAFIDCINKASSQGSAVEVPYGKYYIANTIKITGSDGNVDISGSPDARGNKPVIFSDRFIDLLVIQGKSNSPKGKVSIKGLDLKGNNVPYSSKHPYYNKPNGFKFGIAIANKKEAIVKNCTVEDVYGQGIQIYNTNFSKTSLDDRFVNVDVSNNEVMNTWGLHPSTNNGAFDEYGDGIYVAVASRGTISDNKIINDVNTTRQVGRAGIVVEYDAENIVIEKNTVKGYDRNVHCENNRGKIEIRDNKLTGSEIGILIVEFCSKFKGQPIEIENNYISNEGIPKIAGLQKVFDPNARALLSIFTQSPCNTVAAVKSNQLYVTRNSGIVNQKLLIDQDLNTDFDSNTYKSDLKNKLPIVHKNSVKNVSNESYVNAQVSFTNAKSPVLNKPKNNKLVNSSSNISLQ